MFFDILKDIIRIFKRGEPRINEKGPRTPDYEEDNVNDEKQGNDEQWQRERGEREPVYGLSEDSKQKGTKKQTDDNAASIRDDKQEKRGWDR